VCVTARTSLFKTRHRFASSSTETIMADDLANRGVQDRSLISLEEPHEISYWTKALGVTREELERAVRQVGHGADAVRQALGK
jgi:hypothetical protein